MELPSWIREIGNERNGIILTDDIDSIISYVLLKKKYPTLTIKGFFPFDKLLMESRETYKESIFLDCDSIVNSMKCIGNHRAPDYRDNINFNKFVNDMTYNKKFPFSTAMTILALFYSKVEIDNMSDEFIKLLITIDVGEKGYFNQGGRYKNIHIKWLEEMDLYRVIDVLENSKYQDFLDIRMKYNLIGKLRFIDDIIGYFDTDIDLKQLANDFDLDFTDIKKETYEFKSKTDFNREFIRSLSNIKQYGKPVQLIESYKQNYILVYK